MLYFDEFDFALTIHDWQKNDDLFSQYEEYYGRVSSDNPRLFQPYLDYVSKLEIDRAIMKMVKLPPQLEDWFDYDLLFQLVFASLSSTYYFDYDAADNKLELLISAQTLQQSKMTKKLSNLYSWQIKRLFEIYFSEIMRAQVYKLESAKSTEMYERDHRTCLAQYNTKMQELNMLYTSDALDDII